MRDKKAEGNRKTRSKSQTDYVVERVTRRTRRDQLLQRQIDRKRKRANLEAKVNLKGCISHCLI